MFQTCASVPTSGHLEALTRWRGLCGQPTNPIEEYQLHQAVRVRGERFSHNKYSDYFPLRRSTVDLVIGASKNHDVTL